MKKIININVINIKYKIINILQMLSDYNNNLNSQKKISIFLIGKLNSY